MQLTVFLSGEVHTPWREEIVQACEKKGLPIEFIQPVMDHDASDNIGPRALGEESDPFWHDHKSAKINAMRIRTGIERADVVVVRFGEKYRQWNAAFDAGYATAMGIHLIVMHPPEHRHALKEVDAGAMAVTETAQQVVDVLEYVATKA